MKEKVRFLGLDVHAETIAVAVAEPDGEVRSLGTIANREESIRKLVKKLRRLRDPCQFHGRKIFRLRAENTKLLLDSAHEVVCAKHRFCRLDTPRSGAQ